MEVRLRASVCTVETTVGRSVIEGTALNTGDEIGIFLMRDSNSAPHTCRIFPIDMQRADN